MEVRLCYCKKSRCDFGEQVDRPADNITHEHTRTWTGRLAVRQTHSHTHNHTARAHEKNTSVGKPLSQGRVDVCTHIVSFRLKGLTFFNYCLTEVVFARAER